MKVLNYCNMFLKSFFIICLLTIYSFSIDLNNQSIGGYMLNEEYIQNENNKFINKSSNRYYNLPILEEIEEFSHYDVNLKHIDLILNKENRIKNIYLSYNFNTDIYSILKYDFLMYIKKIEKKYKIRFKKNTFSFNNTSDEVEYSYKNNYLQIKIGFHSNLDNVHNITIELKEIN